MNQYLVPAHEVRARIEIHKSKFIASAGPAFTVEQAREFIDRIRDEFPDASHHVPVYLIGKEPSMIEHCSDAGEPSGTAGRPALAVLKGSGLRDVVVVISRYFGGIKLGTGGLVRAYSDAVRAVLEVLPRAQKIPTHVAKLEISYNWYKRVKQLIQKLGAITVKEDFGTEVAVQIRIPVEKFSQFNAELRGLTNGKIHAEIIATVPDSIFPIDAK